MLYAMNGLPSVSFGLPRLETGVDELHGGSRFMDEEETSRSASTQHAGSAMPRTPEGLIHRSLAGRRTSG